MATRSAHHAHRKARYWFVLKASNGLTASLACLHASAGVIMRPFLSCDNEILERPLRAHHMIHAATERRRARHLASITASCFAAYGRGRKLFHDTASMAMRHRLAAQSCRPGIIYAWLVAKSRYNDAQARFAFILNVTAGVVFCRAISPLIAL